MAAIDTSYNSIPTIFADGVLNVANSHEIVKFYLVRFDPSINNESEDNVTPTAQIVMPMAGFLNLYTFLELRISELIESGSIDKKQLESVRKSFKSTLR